MRGASNQGRLDHTAGQENGPHSAECGLITVEELVLLSHYNAGENDTAEGCGEGSYRNIL
jgi:hypothetical protein